MLSEDQERVFSECVAKYGRCGHVEHDGHFLVFRRPNRDEARDYRKKEDDPAQKYDRVDQLANLTIVAFDALPITDVIKIREAWLSFLGDYPMFTDGPRFQSVFGVLVGAADEEQIKILGKGCSIRSGIRPSSPKA
jgi:hypothetical protein